MAIDPSRIFTESSGKTAAIICSLVLAGVLVAFAIRMFGFQGKFPGPPPLSGKPVNGKKDETSGEGDPPPGS